ncbi:MAG: hypothetical protein AAF220_01730 [Pseudomonadota bacterium]
MRIIFNGSRMAQAGENIRGVDVPEALLSVPPARIGLSQTGEMIDLATRTHFFVNDLGIKHLEQDDPAFQRVDCAWDDDLILDDGTWRVRTSDDDLADLRAVTTIDRGQFASRCAVAGIITWDEATDWATGQSLPSITDPLFVGLTAEQEAQTRFITLATVNVRRSAPEIAALQAVLQMSDADVDALFGISL